MIVRLFSEWNYVKSAIFLGSNNLDINNNLHCIHNKIQLDLQNWNEKKIYFWSFSNDELFILLRKFKFVWIFG